MSNDPITHEEASRLDAGSSPLLRDEPASFWRSTLDVVLLVVCAASWFLALELICTMWR